MPVKTLHGVRHIRVQSFRDEKTELMVDANPAYKEWIAYEPSKKDFTLRTVYLNFTDHFIVEEYNTPEGFGENTYLPPLGV